jgi:ABC-2 type transport system permease protein
MKPANVVAADAVVLSRWPAVRALAAMFVLAVRQQVRGKRLLVLSLLFAMPSVLIVVIRLTSNYPPPSENLEFGLVLNLIPHALVPLAALLYAAGIIQDEVEEQTLTYLLLRPLPRWGLYLMKLLAALLVTAALTAVFTIATFVAIALTASNPTPEMAGRALETAGLLGLTEVGYCGLFGLLGLITRRSLLVGVGYIVLLEGLLATLPTVARRLTVMYYFRVLVLRWLDPANGKEWMIDLTTAPDAQTCVLVLLGIGLVSAALAAMLFAAREFRMKTPEGN